MGSLILPSRFNRQPPEAVQLASTGGVRRPIAAFIPTLSGLHIYAEAKHDLYGKPTGSGVKLTPSSYGIASKGVSPSIDTIRLNAAANQLDTVWEKPATQVTVMLVFQRFGNPVGVSPIFGNQCPNNQPFTAWGLLDTPAGTARFEIALNGANADPVMVQATSPIPNNVPVVMIGRYDGSKVDLWQNGSKIATVNATGSISYPNAADRGPSVGNFYNFTGSNRSALMEIYGGALWDRAISDAELTALSQNPWQLFAAPPRRLWVVSAGGSQSYSYTASGGIQLSGTALGMRTATKTAAGGVLFSGAATRTKGVTKTPSGGLLLSGASTTLRARAIAAVGGLSLSGAAGLLRGASRASLGGLKMAGAATMAFYSAIQTRIVNPVGGILLGGAASVARAARKASSGGFILSGASAVTSGAAGRFRALILVAGILRVIPTAQLGTGKKPIVYIAQRLRERLAAEGTPVILVNGRLRQLQPGETLDI